MECDFENAIASLSQSWDWLEDRRSEDDKMSRPVQISMKSITKKDLHWGYNNVQIKKGDE